MLLFGGTTKSHDAHKKDSNKTCPTYTFNRSDYSTQLLIRTALS